MQITALKKTAAALRDPSPDKAQDIGFRNPPHNIEAEQALLGAILVNNEALDRVSGFLDAHHYFDPLHASIHETIAKLIHAGKQATPITLKTFFENAEPVGDLTVGQYLGRLAASATTIINARDYGRTVYDLAVRRNLILIGEDMVNTAFDSPVDFAPTEQIEDAENKLFSLAESGKYGKGFEAFGTAVVTAIEMAGNAYKRDGGLSGIATGLTDLDGKMGGLQPSDLIVLAGRPAMGKAQPLDAKVLTRTGWKTMGELRLGDQLAAIDGRPSRVAGLFPQGRKQIFRITFSDGRSTECCAEHLWRVWYREWEVPRVLTTAGLQQKLTCKRYKGRLWIDLFAGEFGHKDALPLDPWLLGALIGDGKLSGGSVTFSTAEPEQIARLLERAGSAFAANKTGTHDYRIVTAAGRTRPGQQGMVPNAIKQALVGLGLWDVRSEQKFIPACYLGATREFRIELLRGLLDTDGWAEKWGSVRFTTSSPLLAEGVAELVRSLGGICRTSMKHPHYTHLGERRAGLPSHVINIQLANQAELFHSARKQERVRPFRFNKRLTIASVEPTRVAEAQCIAVTHPEKLYITDDYIVTHNTSLVTNIAFNIARARAKALEEGRGKDGDEKELDGAVVGFFSLEMSSEQLATRILSEQAEIPSEKIRRGMISEDEFRRLRDASAELASLPLYIDQTGGISVAQLAARARKLKRQKGVGLIVVDYLQLLTGSSRRASEGRVQEITEITTGLKALAKELAVPIIALSQLSRQVESREDKRPQLSDLRESGSIEQDADVVLFVYREEYYVQRAEPPMSKVEEYAKWQMEMERVHGLAEVVIGKQRHGPTGTVKLQFNGAITRFGNLQEGDRMPDRHD